MNRTGTLTAVSPKDHFVHLSPGKLAGLQQITDASHRFRVLALDQSNSFRKAIKKMHEAAGSKADATYAEVRDTKIEMVKVLAPYASATLLDVNYGARQALNAFALPKGVGLIVRVEASKDAGIPGELEPGWNVEKIKKMGASAVKLLVYMDVEDAAYTKKQMAFVESIHKACVEQDIIVMVEELTFPRPGEEKGSSAYWTRKQKNVLESTKLLNPFCDVLKLEFPIDIKTASAGQVDGALKELNDIAERPWVLLSAGEKFDLFAKQTEVAMKAGCSGYMAGRAIFNEYFDQPDAAARAKFLSTTGVERMKKLNDIVASYATPWDARYGLKAENFAAAMDPEWYLAGAKAQASGPVKGDY